MYEVIFTDKEHGVNVESFNTFDEAAEYWNDYADAPTCMAGELLDRSNGEVIWRFNAEGGNA
jgi:hypothetical protein